ncbi:DUF1850 domain-containing protein [Natranaerobius trueperi]|uniref:DUF1850 domain-containing protein n=1 Tax=Natranaerobius trueperi TaxID=759412 RepID=A0A226BXQ7_9FIRM|nr:DUF1850 domain-containing protein [Natranaerobius trueperi]OWZ83725.1 hypothetical protein CDO51_07170 [Natranaerobius trueperi]
MFVRTRKPILAFVLIAIVTISLISRSPGLKIVDQQGDILVQVIRLDKVLLKYTHSAMKTPVEDIYTFDQEEMKLVHSKSVHKSLGAGFEFKSGDLGELTTENGRFILKGINKPFEVLTFRYGETADQKIIIKDSDEKKTINLSEHVAPGEQVKIKPTYIWRFPLERRVNSE